MVKTESKIDTAKPFRVGDLVEGTVVGIGRSAVYLDLGPQGTGIIYGREFQEEKGALRDVEVAEKVVAKIVDIENDEGYTGSKRKKKKKKLLRLRSWAQTKAAY
jgi:ribosomal protein S1